MGFCRKLKLPAPCAPHPNLSGWAWFRDVTKLKPCVCACPHGPVEHGEAKLAKTWVHKGWVCTTFLLEFQKVVTPSWDGDLFVAKVAQVRPLFGLRGNQAVQPHVHPVIEWKRGATHRVTQREL